MWKCGRRCGNVDISHLPSMVSVYAEEEESVSRAGEDFGEDAGEEVVLKIVKILLEQLHKAPNG